MNTKRIAVLIGLILIVLLGAIAFAAWYVLHSDLLDEEITDLLQRQLGRPVQVSGQLDLQVFPVPGVSLGDVHIGGEGKEGPVVRVRRVRVSLEPWPLLSGRVVLRGCELVGPQVTLQGGQTLSGEKGRQGTSENSSAGSATSGIDFRKVRVLDGSVAWTGKGGTRVHLREISILPKSGDGKGIDLAGVLLVASGEEGPVLAEGKVQLSCTPRVGALIALEKVRFSFAGNAGMTRRPLAVQGIGRVDLSEKSLELSELSVHRGEFELLSGVRAGRKGEQWTLSLDDLRLNGRQLPGEVTLSGTGTDPHVAVRCGTVDVSLWQDLLQGAKSDIAAPLFQGVLYELTHARGKLDIAVESLPVSDLVMKDVRLSGSLAGGEVRLQGSARMPGGAVHIGLEGLACPEQMTGQGDFELWDATGKSVLMVRPVFVLVPDKLGVRFNVSPVFVAAVRGVTGSSALKTGWLKQGGGNGTFEVEAAGMRLSFSELTADGLTVAGSAKRVAGKSAWDVDLDFQGRDPGPHLSAFKGTAADSGSGKGRNRSLLPRELGSVTVHNLVLDAFRVNRAGITGSENGTAARFFVDGAAYGRSVRVSGEIATDPQGIRMSIAGQGEILVGRTLKGELNGLYQEDGQRFIAETVSWSLIHAGRDEGTLTGTASGVVDVGKQQADLKNFSAKGDTIDCSGPVLLVLSEAPGLSGNLNIRSLKLVSLLQDWGLRLWPMADPQILNDLSGETSVSLNQEQVRFDIPEVKLDRRSRLSGRVDIRFDRPEINLDLDVDYLRLDRLLPGGEDGKDGREEAEKSHRLVVDGTIRAGTVDWRKLRFSDASTRLVLGGGILRFSPLSATLHGGRMKGAVVSDLRPEPSRLAVSLKGSSVELGPLMTRLTGSPKLTGTMDLSLDISGTPGGRSGYLGGLNGTVQLAARKGSIVLETGHSQSFEVLQGSGKITRGRLTCQDFFATFGRSTATGGALIDLGGQTIDGAFVVQTPSVSPLASVPLLNQVRTLTDLSRMGWPSLSFHITGDLLKPKVRLDREQLALDVGKEVITAPVTVGERVLGAGKNILRFGGRAAGKVAETLGGLLGGKTGEMTGPQNNTDREEP